MPKKSQELPLKAGQRLALMKYTADMLALPLTLCPYRLCHRKRSCSLYREEALEPSCLMPLQPWRRALFMELFDIVMAIHDDRLAPYPSKNPARRELEEAAIEIIRHALPLIDEPHFEDWLRRYNAPPQPPVDTARLAAEMRAQLASFRAIDEMRGI
jgi:hypothetical protein